MSATENIQSFQIVHLANTPELSVPRGLADNSFLMGCFTLGIAGGLTNLAKMPACNLMLLGAQRRTLSGFSSTSLLPHTGYIYHCDVVQSLPPVSTRGVMHAGTLWFVFLVVCNCFQYEVAAHLYKLRLYTFVSPF